MQVICTSLGEFLECLDAEPSLFQSTIRVNICRRPVDGNTRDSSKFSVVFQASAVVQLPDGTEYLLEFGSLCGTDYEDSTQERLGSEKATQMKEEVRVYAEKRGFRLLPGVLGY